MNTSRKSSSPAVRITCLAAAAVTTFVLPTAEAAGSAASHHSASHHAHHQRAVPFAFRASGYGTRVKGGQLPLASGTTSLSTISCTNTAGRNQHNHLAQATLPSLGRATGVATRTWTSRAEGLVSSNSSHDIARLVLAQSQFGTLSVRAISSSASASHDRAGFHAAATTTIGSVSFARPGGATQPVAVPTPGHPVLIPGLLNLSIGSVTKSARSTQATARAGGLDVTLIPTNTKVTVAHSYAFLSNGVTRGLFHGRSNATRVSAVDANVKSGPQPNTVIPCAGTFGKVTGTSLARVLLANGKLDVQGASTRQMGNQNHRKAYGFEQARVAHLDLGNGRLVIDGILGQANVVRTRHGVSADSKGTSFLKAVANGRTYTFPELDGLTIPGLVSIDTNVTTRSRTGIDVIAVRLTLLDGSGAVVDLGHAHLNIRNARLG